MIRYQEGIHSNPTICSFVLSKIFNQARREADIVEKPHSGVIYSAKTHLGFNHGDGIWGHCKSDEPQGIRSNLNRQSSYKCYIIPYDSLYLLISKEPMFLRVRISELVEAFFAKELSKQESEKMIAVEIEEVEIKSFTQTLSLPIVKDVTEYPKEVNLEKVMECLQGALKLAHLLGYEGNEAIERSSTAVKNLIGVNPLELFTLNSSSQPIPYGLKEISRIFDDTSNMQGSRH